MSKKTAAPITDDAPRANIELGSFVEVVLTYQVGFDKIQAFPGVLLDIGDRGILLGPSEKQLAEHPGAAPSHVTFFTWHAIAFISVVVE